MDTKCCCLEGKKIINPRTWRMIQREREELIKWRARDRQINWLKLANHRH